MGLIQTIKRMFIKKDDKSEIFNSIRINALVDELKDKGIISNDEYEGAMKRQIDLLLQRRSG